MEQPEIRERLHNPKVREKIGIAVKAWHHGDTESAAAQKVRWMQYTIGPKSEESIQKMKAALKASGHMPKERGGNGTGLTVPQKMLLDCLGAGWIPEHAVSLGKRQAGYPTHYKIDVANPSAMIAVEIDGRSHAGRQRKKADRKKDAALQDRGWIVLRFSNAEILNSIHSVKEKIVSQFTTSQ
jgi:hypothetical protein